MEETKRRYVGIYLGKREYTMAIINRKGKVSIHQGKTSDQGRQALYRLLVLNSAKLPIVPLPSEKEIERRKTLSSYSREMRYRTRHINALHALFVHGISIIRYARRQAKKNYNFDSPQVS